MANSYATVKEAVIDVVDDFTPLEILKDYGVKYSATTKLEKIGIGAPSLAVMPPRFNKRLREVTGAAWHPVGPIDLVAQATIGQLIIVACGQSGTAVPDGEPT